MWTTVTVSTRRKNMKLKAVFFDDKFPTLISALERIRADVMREILIPHLKVAQDFGPAEFYIQRSDSVVKDTNTPSTDWMCEVRLTGVSGPTINFKRSVANFWEAGKSLTGLYRQKIKSCVPKGHRMQLFVVIMIDESIPVNSLGTRSPLIKNGPEWVHGEVEQIP